MTASEEMLTIEAEPPQQLAADELTISPPKRFVWIRGLRSAKVAVGAAIVLFFVLVAVFGPLLYPVDPSAVGPDVLSPPSSADWLGTTSSGQDCLAQLIDGTSTSLLVGFLCGLIATALSVIIGLIGGYLRGLPDEFLSLLSNVFLVIPTLPLVVVLAGYLPNGGTLSIVLVISLTSWAFGARVLRAQALSLRKRDFVTASRATGESTPHIIFREMMPNMAALIVSSFLFTVIFAVLTEAGLAFLGLGDVSQWSWGTILYWAQNESAMQVGAWWWFVPAGLCIALLGMGLALMNFGIDEFVNPRLRVARIGTRRARKAKE